MSKELVDCRFFMQGHCSRGLHCQFRHVEAARRSEITCEAWQSAQCHDANCEYAHPQDQLGAASRSICIYYLHGRCKHGASCQFYHPARRQNSVAENDLAAVTATTDPDAKQPSETKRKAAGILSKYSSSKIGRDMHVPVRVKRQAVTATKHQHTGPTAAASITTIQDSGADSQQSQSPQPTDNAVQLGHDETDETDETDEKPPVIVDKVEDIYATESGTGSNLNELKSTEAADCIPNEGIMPSENDTKLDNI